LPDGYEHKVRRILAAMLDEETETSAAALAPQCMNGAPTALGCEVASTH
jgi:hypothetical protein